jgi:predicted RecB family nuclease
VYLDIEGIPDSDSYYLIGALIVSEGQEIFHSFWADQWSQEPEIFARFGAAIGELADFRVLHFGDYETVALRRMKARLPQSIHPKIDAILERATNLLSVIHPHIYFPTYANGLKDIGRFLEIDRADKDATGLQTIVWRKRWTENQAPDLKTRLLQYNQDDCRTLKRVFEFIQNLTQLDSAAPTASQTAFKTIHTEELIKDRPRWELFRPKEYASEDLKKVAKCAYFDYQREKVFVRTHPYFKTVNKRHRKFRRTVVRVNKIRCRGARICPRCQSRNIEKGNPISHDLFDLKFFKGGVKKWITRFVSWQYCCSECNNEFTSKNISRPRL